MQSRFLSLLTRVVGWLVGWVGGWVVGILESNAKLNWNLILKLKFKLKLELSLAIYPTREIRSQNVYLSYLVIISRDLINQNRDILEWNYAVILWKPAQMSYLPKPLLTCSSHGVYFVPFFESVLTFSLYLKSCLGTYALQPILKNLFFATNLWLLPNFSFGYSGEIKKFQRCSCTCLKVWDNMREE